jgi:hypothetical protein
MMDRMAEQPKRQSQFRMRTLMILFVIVAIPCALLESKPEHERRGNQAVARIRELDDSIEDRRDFTSADSWYSPPPSAIEFTSLDKGRFAPVAEARQSGAQAALADVPAKRITAEEAARLVGRPLPVGGECVLLRAVVLFEGTGGYDVGMSGRAVRVHHDCLGRHPAPMRRKALVAVLPSVPETVFVSCSMAE